MQLGFRRLATAAVISWLASGAAQAEFRIYEGRGDPFLKLREAAVSGGKSVSLTVGIGSGAFRGHNDPPNMFWTVSDRGPNFTADEAESITGVPGTKLCGQVKPCRVYLAPDYPPSISRIEVREDGTFRVVDAIALKTRSGLPVTGMLNPLTIAAAENAVDGNGRPLKQDVNAVDAEAIVRLSDGTFWIGDENGPSILHVNPDGTIGKRLVPAGTEGDYAGAQYDVIGSLPAILARRFVNRGIESLAVSEDERSLFFMLQNPLANPNTAAYQDAANTRIVRLDRESLRPVAEYVYVLEPPSAWKGEESKRQSNVRISELVAIEAERFLVLERTDQTSKVFEITVSGATNILRATWDDSTSSPSLEQVKLADVGIVPVEKVLRFDSLDHPAVPSKLEGIAKFGDGSLMLINDDDFGISGASTKVVRVAPLPSRKD